MRAAVVRDFNADLSIETVDDPACPTNGVVLMSHLVGFAVQTFTAGQVGTPRSWMAPSWAMNIVARWSRPVPKPNTR